MEQVEAEADDINLLSDDDCEADDRGEESQLTTDHEKRKRKRDPTEHSQTDSSHDRPNKSVRREEVSRLSSSRNIARDSTPHSESDVGDATPTRKPDGAASRKKGKEKMRDGPPQRTPPVLRGSKYKPVRNKRRRQQSHRGPRSTRPTKSRRVENAHDSPTVARTAVTQRETDNYEKNKDQNDQAGIHPEVKTSFVCVPNGDKKCIHCDSIFSGNTSNSSLKYHLNSACKVLVHKIKTPEFTNARANALVCRMIAEDCLSLRLTDSPNLRALLDYLRPGYKPPSRTTLTKTWLPKIRESLKKCMAEKLGKIDHLSISFDGWTTIVMRKFLAILCHGITPDWKLDILAGYCLGDRI